MTTIRLYISVGDAHRVQTGTEVCVGIVKEVLTPYHHDKGVETTIAQRLDLFEMRLIHLRQLLNKLFRGNGR